jgi:predicted DNA-binding WGR domain protein
MKRYFINQEGEANKFWNIEVVGTVYTVTFGKIGKLGRESRKELADAAMCAAEAAKLIQEKQRKGYYELAGNAPIPERTAPIYPPMDEPLFWEILSLLNWKKAGNDDAVLLPAEKRLATLSLEDIFAFEDILAEKLYQLDGEKYAVACYPGQHPSSISADAFLYDRCSVLCNGPAFYEKVVQDPTKWPVGLEFESLLYLAGKAYARKTGQDDFPHTTRVSYETGSNTAGWDSPK